MDGNLSNVLLPWRSFRWQNVAIRPYYITKSNEMTFYGNRALYISQFSAPQNRKAAMHANTIEART